MVVGYTVIVKTDGIPIHPFAAGVTVMVAIAGAGPLLVATNAEIFPVPLAASPMDGAEFVHEKVVPATGPPNVIAEVVTPLQYARLATWFTPGVGLMVNVKDMGGPVHPFAAGITVMVAIIAVIPLFDAVNEGIFPVPFAPSPMDGLLFVHVKVVPATGPLNAIGAVMTPSQ